jgi:hypothetical protein
MGCLDGYGEETDTTRYRAVSGALKQGSGSSSPSRGVEQRPLCVVTRVREAADGIMLLAANLIPVVGARRWCATRGACGGSLHRCWHLGFTWPFEGVSINHEVTIRLVY